MFFQKRTVLRVAAGIALMSAPAAWGQSPAGRQVARTHWQPVRPVQATEELPSPSDQRAVPVPHRSGRPAPMQDSNGRSVMVSPSEGETVYHEPLDGQIIYEGDFESFGGYEGFVEPGCDALACDSGACFGVEGHGVWRPCMTVCLPQDGWVSFEYLGWFQRGMKTPVLAATDALPDGRVLFGGEDLFEGGISGGRLRFGLWLDQCHTWAAAAEYFQLGTSTAGFSGTPNDFTTLVRPFTNALNGQENAQLIVFPDQAAGRLDIDVSSSLVGGGFHFRRQINSSCGTGRGILHECYGPYQSRADALFGYRYVQLDEAIGIRENVTDLANPGLNNFQIHDHFRTFNQFNGFDMGIAYQRVRGPWSLDLLVKLAIGNTRQRVDITGTTQTNNGPSEPGGGFALDSNIGSYTRDHFTVMPELGAGIGYQCTHNLRLTLGYTLIVWSNAVRPGDQIDLLINPNRFPPSDGSNPARPRFDLRDTDYWVQGINTGIEFTW